MAGTQTARTRFAAPGGGLPGPPGPPGGGSPSYHTVTAPELAAKQFTLAAAPTSFLWADVVNGAILQNGVDFQIVGAVFDWNGFGLDGVIQAGDVVRVIKD